MYEATKERHDNGAVEPELSGNITAEMVVQYEAQQTQACAGEIQAILDKYNRTLQAIAEIKLVRVS